MSTVIVSADNLFDRTEWLLNEAREKGETVLGTVIRGQAMAFLRLAEVNLNVFTDDEKSRYKTLYRRLLRLMPKAQSSAQ